jgi:hypothetical protein
LKDFSKKELDGSDTYLEAYNLAVRDFFASNPEERARRSGAQCIPRDNRFEIRLSFLGREIKILVTPADKKIVFEPAEIHFPEKIVILHYLNGDADSPPTGELIGFEGIPDGRQYLANFRGRTYVPLLKKFGSDPEKIVKAAAQLGGEKAEFGDFSVAIPVLPRIRITIILWRGDEELGPEAKIVFDRNIVHQLPVEDIIVLCNLIAIRLIKSA